jgi:hypothetical protein
MIATRHDFFTLIHKGQRKELFAATVLAGMTTMSRNGWRLRLLGTSTSG